MRIYIIDSEGFLCSCLTWKTCQLENYSKEESFLESLMPHSIIYLNIEVFSYYKTKEMLFINIAFCGFFHIMILRENCSGIVFFKF